MVESTPADHQATADGSGHAHPSSAVLFVGVVLLIGIATRNLMKKVPVPYTALLLVWGILIGVADSSFANWQHMGAAIELWKSMDPGLLLLVFLPVLIFASANALDFHTFKQCFGQVLVLAGPGVFIGTGLLGVCMKYLFPYNWNWSQCLMFGAMMSATDPVAVVALLKEVGASQKLGTVIEGESLFNDGTAYVIFLLFKEMVGGSTRNPMSSFGFFCQMALGGPALGVGFAIMTTWWLGLVFNDAMVEISMTLVTAYLTFYVAEDLLVVSGVLAVVALGVTMSAMASSRISPEVHHPMHIFWEMMEYFANTLIFVYSGVVIAVEIYNAGDSHNEEHIELEDWGYAILLFILLQIIRAITIILLYPALKRMGYGLNWRDAVVMVWGGLRGAVGLALALIVKLDSNIVDHKFQALVVFYMGLMAAATLIVNGTSMPFLLKVLGVVKPTPAKLEVLQHVVQEIEQYGENHLAHLKHDNLLGNPDWDRVMRATKMDVSSIIPSSDTDAKIEDSAKDNLCSKTTNGKKDSAASSLKRSITELVKRSSSADSNKNAVSVVTREMVRTDLRTRLLEAAKATYGEGFEKGYIGINAIGDLKESADRALDHLTKPLSDWDTIERMCRIPRWMKYMQKLTQKRFKRLEKLSQKFLFGTVEYSVVLSTSYVFGHREAQKGLRQYIEVTCEDDYGKSPQWIAQQKMKWEVSKEVCTESQVQCQKAIQFTRFSFRALNALTGLVCRGMSRAFPEIIRAIKTKQASHTVLMHKRRFLDRLSKAGLIEQKEWRQLMTLLGEALKKLIYTPPRLQLPDSKTLLRSQYLFSDVDDETFDSYIWPLATSCVYDKGQPIFLVGQEATHLTMIVRGVVHVKSEGTGELREEGIGAIIGITEILLNQPRARDLMASTIVEVYQIEASVMRDLIQEHEGLALKSWQMAGVLLAQQLHVPEFEDLDYSELQKLFRSTTLEVVPAGQNIQIVGDTFLLHGIMELTVPDVGEEDFTFEGPVLMTADPAFYTCISNVKLLNFPDNWTASVDRVDMKAMLMLKGTSYRDRRVTRAQSMFRGSNTIEAFAEPNMRRQSMVRPTISESDKPTHSDSMNDELPRMTSYGGQAFFKPLGRRQSTVRPVRASIMMRPSRESRDGAPWEGLSIGTSGSIGTQSIPMGPGTSLLTSPPLDELGP